LCRVFGDTPLSVWDSLGGRDESRIAVLRDAFQTEPLYRRKRIADAIRSRNGYQLST
jgi:hypothetical protein